MLIGILHPMIMLPEKQYSDTQLQNILLHELTHLRRHDIIMKWLSVLAGALHWFNPIVYLVRREIDRACELACDEAVIMNLDDNGKQNYGDTLIAVVAEHKTPKTVLSTTMGEEKKVLKERLTAIMRNKKRSHITILISAVLLIAVAGTAIALGAGSSDTQPTEFPLISLSGEDGSAMQPVRLGYDYERDGISVIADSIAAWQADFTDAATAYLTPSEIMTVSSADAIDAFHFTFYRMNGEAVRDGGFDNAAGNAPALKCFLTAPTKDDEYVCSLEFRIDKLGFEKIEYAFKIVVDEADSPESASYINPDSALDIEAAISQAILSQNEYDHITNPYNAEAHVTLKTANNADSVTAYVYALSHAYTFENGILQEVGGSSMPVAITFHKGQDGTYSLVEYWTPKDGSYYTSSIQEKFPSDLWDKVNTQLYVDDCRIAALRNAQRHFGITDDEMPVINTLQPLEIQHGAEPDWNDYLAFVDNVDGKVAEENIHIFDATVDYNTPGVYGFSIVVCDRAGNENRANSHFTVK
jgi:hypothetical protein